MKLYSPAFEKSLRRSVRSAIKASPELKREAKHSGRRNYHIINLIRPLISVLVGFMVANIVEETGHVQTGLALLSCWTLTVMVFRAPSFSQCLYSDADLTALSMLPVAPEAIFRRQVQKFLGRSAYAFADIAAGLTGLGVAAHFSIWQWLLVPLITVLAGITLLGAAVFCAIRARKYLGAAAGLSALGWLPLIFLNQHGAVQTGVHFLDKNADWLNLFLPTGWSLAVMQPFLQPGCWFNLGMFGLIGLTWWQGKELVARVRAGYFFRETPREEAADMWPADELPAEDMFAGQRPKHFGETTIEELITSRNFLTIPTWEARGWMERRLGRWLKPREKTVLETAYPDGVSLTKRWKLVFYVFGGFLVAGLAAGLIDPVWEMWIAGLGILFSFVVVLGSLADTGQIFQPRACSGVNVPLYAMLGLGFRELARVFFKCAVVQLPGLVPWSAASGVAVAHLFSLARFCEVAPMDAALHGIRAGAMIFAGRFIILVFNFSGGTNDSARGFRSIFIFLTMVVFGGPFLLLGMLGIFIPLHRAAFIVTAVSMLCAWALFRIYGWFYHRNRFDLMSMRRN